MRDAELERAHDFAARVKKKNTEDRTMRIKIAEAKKMGLVLPSGNPLPAFTKASFHLLKLPCRPERS